MMAAARGLPSFARHDSSSATAVVRGYDPRALLAVTSEPMHVDDSDADTEVSKETLVDAWVALVPTMLVELRSILAARMVPHRTGMLLAHVDGCSSVSDIIEASGECREVAVNIFMKLEANGLVRVG